MDGSEGKLHRVLCHKSTKPRVHHLWFISFHVSKNVKLLACSITKLGQREALSVPVSMAELKLDTHPGHSLHLLLFVDVTNSRELVGAMQAGTLSPELAFFTAALVPDTFPVLAAAHKTLTAQSRDGLITRTLHSELIYNYSGSKHITESLRRCGINDSSNYVLVARFDATPEELEATRALVKGTEISLQELSKRANEPLILKHYKVTPLELDISSLSDAITCRIAARDAM